MLSLKNAVMAGLLVIALAAFVIFWDSKPEIFMGKKQPPVSALSSADSYMKSTVTRKFNAQGRPAFVLTSTEGEYFQAQNRFVMAVPQVLAHGSKEGEQPWHLSAAQSVILNSGQQIDMRGEVYAWQQVGPAKSGQKTEIATPFLSYYPDSQQANTDKPISFKTPGHKVNGTGFKGDFAAQTYQILSRVKGRHHAYH
ncbi:MAG: LPS export ABC transporter periplasmic protein LptC [Gammaproteobacteria bacterium]|nr:LPS export ABC transporter periplasmic protein LptC [Gammaproteobacteria bacterium]MBQ0839701.1 LPS export ABC transporter periplasmic protein LptC [Gammaproteobacteria bacterium]